MATTELLINAQRIILDGDADVAALKIQMVDAIGVGGGFVNVFTANRAMVSVLVLPTSIASIVVTENTALVTETQVKSDYGGMDLYGLEDYFPRTY